MLRPVVTRGGGEPRRAMPQANGGASLVSFLSAGSAGAVMVHQALLDQVSVFEDQELFSRDHWHSPFAPARTRRTATCVIPDLAVMATILRGAGPPRLEPVYLSDPLASLEENSQATIGSLHASQVD